MTLPRVALHKWSPLWFTPRMTVADAKPTRLTASPATLVVQAIGGPRAIGGKLIRLGRTLRLYVDGREIERRLQTLQAKGYIDRRPTRLQLLFERSAEGDTQGLGILPGVARRFAEHPDRPVPHMGWNQLRARRGSPLLAGIDDGEHAYFVHSYALPAGPETVATADSGGEFSAVVSHRNFHGAQFHPERSARAGARLLANFLDMT